jgi:hypothetical protein
MTNQQLETLLQLYKKALANNLTVIEFSNEVQNAKIELDKSFVQNGAEDTNLGVFLEELNELQKNMNNE